MAARDAKRLTAMLGELDCIVDEVQKYLRKRAAVGVQSERLRSDHRKRQTFFIGLRAQRRCDFVDNRPAIDGLDVEIELAGFEISEPSLRRRTRPSAAATMAELEDSSATNRTKSGSNERSIFVQASPPEAQSRKA